MHVTLRAAIGPLDALQMRRIRNTCRTFMTRDQSHIGVLRQLWWWWFKRPSTLHPFLFQVDDEVVGYGIVIEEGYRGMLTGGLLPEWRGKGYGTKLFGGLILRAQERGLVPALEVLDRNEPAKRLYMKLGFGTVGVKESLAQPWIVRTMELR